MTWYILIAALAAPVLALISKAMHRYPRLYCALHGHSPRCSIEDYGVMKWHCEHCHTETARQ